MEIITLIFVLVVVGAVVITDILDNHNDCPFDEDETDFYD